MSRSFRGGRLHTAEHVVYIGWLFVQLGFWAVAFLIVAALGVAVILLPPVVLGVYLRGRFRRAAA